MSDHLLDPIEFLPQATALTIAGSDPSGGAGLQADLKTFQQWGVYGASVVTLLTVQNTQAVTQVEVLPPDFILAQLDAVLEDIPPKAIKTGALGNVAAIDAVAERLAEVQAPLILDPVLVSKHGHALAEEEAVETLRQALLPKAWMITPNRFEVERLTGVIPSDQSAICEAVDSLLQLGTRYLLLKLGEYDGQARHVLAGQDQVWKIDVPRQATKQTHGTGCVLSACIAALMARELTTTPSAESTVQGEKDLGFTDLQRIVLTAIGATYQAIATETRLGQGLHPAETRQLSNASLSNIEVQQWK